MTHPTSPTPSGKEQARLERVAAIRDGAITRQQLGILAQHRRTDDGQHQVWWFDHDASTLRTFDGATLQEAVDKAKRWRAGR